MWALRAQTDKLEYAAEMRRVLEATPNLSIREAMVTGVDIGPNDEVRGVSSFFGMNFAAKAVVLTTGTFMNGKIWVGRASMAAGRAGEAPSTGENCGVNVHDSHHSRSDTTATGVRRRGIHQDLSVAGAAAHCLHCCSLACLG